MEYLIFAIIFFISIYVIKQTKHSKRIKNLPGPGQHFLGSITNMLALRDVTSKIRHNVNCDLVKYVVLEKWAKEYGPIYKFNLGPFPVITLSSPQYVEKLLSSKNVNHFQKGPLYNILRPFLRDGLVLSNGEKWKERRRVLNKHMFSFTTLQSHISIFNQEGDNLVCELGKGFFLDGIHEEREIESFLKKAVLNIIWKAVIGVNVHELEKKYKTKGEPYLTEVTDGFKHTVGLRIIKPWFFYDPLWRLHPLSKQDELGANMAYKYVATVIANNDKLVDSDRSNHGIIQHLKQEGLPLDGILEESATLLNAGYETTFTSIHFAIFLLALNPEHQERCREEVDSVFEDSKLCPSGDITYGGLRKLKYLEMCVNESLRILPTAFFTFRKINEPLKLEDDLILPEGSHVCVYVPGIHMDPEIYPEPNKFVPERFSTEEIKKRHHYAHIPFSGGPRVCVGYKLAMMEMVVLIAKILRHYVITTTDRLEDVVFLPNLTLTPQKRMKFSLLRRHVSK